ncbi:MAG: hypothetical protein LBT24_00745, partial [Tannerella sp.]|nr:hypothetical protein [Tannerella sp.]
METHIKVWNVAQLLKFALFFLFCFPAIAVAEPLQPLESENDLLTLFRSSTGAPMYGVKKIVFAVRSESLDGHWYANFGYYADDENRLPFPNVGGKLCVYDLDTKKVQILLDDPKGAVRDPQVHYSGDKIIFSYRPGGTIYYHLYEINTDGNGLKQLTAGDFDDFEPAYLAAGNIIFVSSRAKRWV